MNYQETKDAVTRLYTAVIAQAVRDLVAPDPEDRKSAEEFFKQKQPMPTGQTQSFFDTTRRLLENYKDDPQLMYRISTFKKLSAQTIGGGE